MEAVTVRFATEADFKAICHFINELEEQVFDESVQHGMFLENIKSPDIIYLLAFAESEPVGMISCHIQNLMHHSGKVGEIQEMFVSESARSLGVGKKLLTRIKEIAEERNLKQLEVTSRLKREAAHRFYEREGFNFTHKKFTFY
ncbi:MAG TPA: GNAT family N-acetyltransferase [Flavobacterium sp.]|nr:GNAT family N-acetyltransferase [Flavobacterium sp.]